MTRKTCANAPTFCEARDGVAAGRLKIELLISIYKYQKDKDTLRKLRSIRLRMDNVMRDITLLNQKLWT